MTDSNIDRPLRIGIISYRSNPHSGGQGVYIRNLTRGLLHLGHRVEVISGPPDPQIDSAVKLTMLPCLDLYNPEDLFRIPKLHELIDPISLIEWLGVATMGFPEMFTFGLRTMRYLRNRFHEYDIIHDNQSLSYGIWAIGKYVPTIATIHHPITVDRQIAIRSVRSPWKKMKHFRWYSFIGMQKRVSRKLAKIITVSACARDDISRDFNVPKNRFTVVPNGINTEVFYRLPEVRREKNRIIVTNSADTPLKGLYYLLHAVSDIVRTHDIRLFVIGTPKKDGGIVKLIRKLGIGKYVRFTGRIDDREFVRQYAKATMAVVPSVYEGFGLPAGEAMACGVPVISTTGGALPEVVGDAGVLVPPANAGALAKAILSLLDNPAYAQKLGEAGYKRVQEQFTWDKAAERTVAAYKEVINGYGRF